MLFTSPEYIVFSLIFFPIYFALPLRWRWVWLLLAGYVFYGYGHAQYLWIIALTTAVDYTVGRLLVRTASKRRRTWLLAASLSLNLGVLFFFKYFNFFSGSVASTLSAIGITSPVGVLSLTLPVGISFYTFQSMAYTIDVYRGKIPAERHAGIFAAFVAFFPQMLAGPIERAEHLLPQFRQRFRFDEARTVEGLQRILWGLFKKVVIADRLAIYVNAVYEQPQAYTGAPLILATIFFAFQIYCDFSGYTDIALGTARIMGFSLSENFRQPYFSASVREFWSRWHITLSTWFRDYLYIPLGGNRVALPRQLLNLMIVFLASGLWHGANWTFIVWGGLHGLFVCVETVAARRSQGQLPPTNSQSVAIQIGRVLLTFFLVGVAWVFFRATSFADAGYIFTHALLPSNVAISAPFTDGLLDAPLEFMLSIFLIAVLMLVDAVLARPAWGEQLRRIPAGARWSVYYVAFAAVLFSGLYGVGAQQFVYFQF